VKGREPGKPPPVVVADGDALSTLVLDIPDFAQTSHATALARSADSGAARASHFAVTGDRHQCAGADDGRGAALGASCGARTCARFAGSAGGDIGQLAGATGNDSRARSLQDVAPELLRSVDIVLDGEPSAALHQRSSIAAALRRACYDRARCTSICKGGTLAHKRVLGNALDYQR
jgi:hypothetical protein